MERSAFLINAAKGFLAVLGGRDGASKSATRAKNALAAYNRSQSLALLRENPVMDRRDALKALGFFVNDGRRAVNAVTPGAKKVISEVCTNLPTVSI